MTYNAIGYSYCYEMQHYFLSVAMILSMSALEPGSLEGAGQEGSYTLSAHAVPDRISGTSL